MRRALGAGARLAACLLLGVLGVACPRSAGPSGDSETHFLTLCDGACAAGLSCVCGVCTSVCESDVACQGFDTQAQCVGPTAFSSSEPDCVSQLGEARLCDQRCDGPGDCASLGPDYVCEAGACRARPEPLSGEDATLPPLDAGPVQDAALTFCASGALLRCMCPDGSDGFVLCRQAPGGEQEECACPRPLEIPCDVDMILETYCRGCHAAKPMFGAPMPLMTWLDVQGDAPGSALPVYDAIAERLVSPTDPMPPPGVTQLPPAVLERLRNWVADAASPGEGCVP